MRPGYVFFLFLSLWAAPVAASEPLSVADWWCLPLSRHALDCERYIPEKAPSTSQRVVAVSAAPVFDGPEECGARSESFSWPEDCVRAATRLRLQSRQTGALRLRDFTRRDGALHMRYARPDTLPGREPVFVMASPHAAYTTFFGGSTSMRLKRIPALDQALDAALRAARPLGLLRAAIIRSKDGSPLLRHDPDRRSLTALGPTLVKRLGGAALAVVGYEESWTEKGNEAAVIVATPQGDKFKLAVAPQTDALRLYHLVFGQEYLLAETPLAAESAAALR